ncbi:MAG: hypothetical protein JXR91_16465 [Deltaproteobacteria bacterium]|nr:hypothetical protein [Deltaproteobacteria bacterium]
MASRDLAEKIKIGLTIGSIVVLFSSYILAVLKKRFKDNEEANKLFLETPVLKLGQYSYNAIETFLALLIFLGAAGTVNYASYSHMTNGTHIDEYDLMHYYVTPKYFSELGYFNLLPAILAADEEMGRHCKRTTTHYLAQTENDYAITPISFALSQRDAVKSKFTPEKWKEFVHDVKYLQRDVKPMGCSLWRQLLLDHGFNGTPVWVLVARPLTKLISIENVRILTHLDLLWLVIALLSVNWAFGSRTAAIALLFMTLSYSFRWPTVGWSLLRYDWISSIIIGLSLLKKKKHTASGAFFAYAALMRYFPAIWMVGIVAKGIHELVTRKEIPVKKIWRRISPKYYKMALGFFALSTLLLSISFAVDGVDTHKQSLENMNAHVQPHNLSSRRMGFILAPVYRGESDMKWISEEKKQMVEKIETPVRVFAIAVIIILGLFMTSLKDWEAVGLGFIPFFLLTTSSYYYYVVLLSGVVIHAKGFLKPWHLFGLISMFLIQLYFNAAEHFNPGMRYPTISIVCIMLSIYTLMILIFTGNIWYKNLKIKEAEIITPEKKRVKKSKKR